MNDGKWKYISLSAVLMGCAAQAWAAGDITKIEPSATSVTLEGGKAVVKFTVSGSAEDTDSCGIWIDYGDGDSPDTRVISKSEGLFPRTFEHTFKKPGGFSVKARGQRVKQTFGCNGEVSAFVTVTAPAAAVKKSAAAPKPVAAPTCPDGWQLVASSVNKKTGEFACGPKAPATKIDCGAGLAYYAKGSTIGCRKGR
ncbi:MAG: hypothetical protein HY661_19765 [Betaproteobacteria bacterium]|nr:hypothetical protein [Betaproteobacteria bacterium]